jgi:transcriptional regulator with GAF, ATPase, and Fis domain
MEKLRRLAGRLAGMSDRKAFLDHLVDLAVEMTGAERGIVVMGSAERPAVESARNVDQESLRGREARLSLSIARHAMEQQTTLLIEDASRQEGFALSESVFELGLKSVLCAPVSLDGVVVGALYVDSRFIPAAFGPSDAAALETLAEFLSLFLWKTSVAADRTALEERLRQTERLLQELRDQVEEMNRMAVLARRVSGEPGKGPRVNPYPPMIGEGPAMERVYAIIEKVLENDVTVLVLGESGTGKELVARAVHTFGRRRDKPFVAINCSSIPATLIESELFGHVKGSFTGATRDKKGLFEVADTGTLFMDEVGDMPMEMQGKLLRALQYGEIQRVGSVAGKKVDVRVVAATNRNLEEMVGAGTFREDLFYRLNIVTIEVPPLRRRKEDIPLLVQHFMEENRKQGLSKVRGITPQALMLLSRHPWPGNVRELETCIKSACLFAEKPMLDADDFESLERSDGQVLDTSDPSLFEGRTLADMEKTVILSTLKRNRGNKKKTAVELGIDRRTLYNKLAAWGMKGTA